MAIKPILVSTAADMKRTLGAQRPKHLRSGGFITDCIKRWQRENALNLHCQQGATPLCFKPVTEVCSLSLIRCHRDARVTAMTSFIYSLCLLDQTPQTVHTQTVPPGVTIKAHRTM